MAKNILLTGATGFIGSHVLQGLLQKEFNVIVILRPTSDTRRIHSLQDKFSSFIVSDTMIDFEPLFARHKIDTIIHAATDYGRNSQLSDVLMSNVLFPVRLMEAGTGKGLKRFINTDSFFGKNNQTASYLRNYIHSKKMLLDILKDQHKQLRIDNLRLEHPFGENDSEGKFVPTLVKEMKQGKGKIPLTEGNQKRDFIYVKDVANAFIKVLEQDDEAIGFTEYEVGTGHSITVKEFVQTLAAVMQSGSTLAFGELPTRADEIPDSRADTANLNALGWFPLYDLKTALQNTMSDILNKTV